MQHASSFEPFGNGSFVGRELAFERLADARRVADPDVGPATPTFDRAEVHAGFTAQARQREVDCLGARLDCYYAIYHLHSRNSPLFGRKVNVAAKHGALGGDVLHNFDCENAEGELHASDDDVRAWLDQVMRQTGLKATPLAKAAGLAPSTLIRALDPNGTSSLERRSILKIMEAFGVPGPGRREPASGGFAEPDLAPYELPAVAALLPPNHYLRQVQSRVLDLCGILPGDVLTLDQSLKAQAGDVVDAQVYAGMSAETVLRLHDPPYLVTRSTDPAVSTKPLLIDQERVRIAAVMLELRRHRGAATSSKR